MTEVSDAFRRFLALAEAQRLELTDWAAITQDIDCETATALDRVVKALRLAVPELAGTIDAALARLQLVWHDRSSLTASTEEKGGQLVVTLPRCGDIRLYALMAHEFGHVLHVVAGGNARTPTYWREVMAFTIERFALDSLEASGHISRPSRQACNRYFNSYYLGPDLAGLRELVEGRQPFDPRMLYPISRLASFGADVQDTANELTDQTAPSLISVVNQANSVLLQRANLTLAAIPDTPATRPGRALLSMCYLDAPQALCTAAIGRVAAELFDPKGYVPADLNGFIPELAPTDRYPWAQISVEAGLILHLLAQSPEHISLSCAPFFRKQILSPLKTRCVMFADAKDSSGLSTGFFIWDEAGAHLLAAVGPDPLFSLVLPSSPQ